MPCFKKRNRGRTPTQLEAIAAAGLTDLDCRWYALQQHQIPGASNRRAPDACLIAAPEIAGCIESFFSARGTLDIDRTLRLRTALAELEAAIATLPPSELDYFSELRTLAQGVLAYIRSAA